jgi:hypothetical protein
VRKNLRILLDYKMEFKYKSNNIHFRAILVALQSPTEECLMSTTTVGANTLHHHSRPMGGRDPHEAHRVVTPLELLFDLTFVISFGLAPSQLAHALADGHYLTALLGFAFASFGICWAWTNHGSHRPTILTTGSSARHYGADDRRAGPGARPATPVRVVDVKRSVMQLTHAILTTAPIHRSEWGG